MQTFDWIVVGNGITGAALSYELARAGLSVLLLEKSLSPDSATRYSYGGIPHWSGSTELLRSLCHDGWARHQALAAETGVSTELRELDLLLTVDPEENVQTLAERYQSVEVPPQPITPQEAAAREPQLNSAAIAGALLVRHGHVSPMALVKAYNQGLQKAGGHLMIAPVTGLVRIGDRITGVTTPTQAYAAGNVAIAAGGYTRALMREAKISVPVYFTHAEILETPPLDTAFRTVVMPANLTRSGLEAKANGPDAAALWDNGSHELVPPILDSGFVQLLDHSVRIGQISRLHTSLTPETSPQHSEKRLRQGIAHLIPALEEAPGQWRSCQVAFSQDGLPLAGPVPGVEGVAVFSGFSSPFALVPAAATWFARWAIGEAPAGMEALFPSRFINGSA